MNELTIAYLFLGGAGAGAGLVLTLVSWLAAGVGLRRPAATAGAGLFGSLTQPFVPAPAEHRLLGFGYVVAAAVQALGMLCLLFDMGRPDKALIVLINPHVSVTSIGAYALGGLVLLCVVLALVWLGVLRVPRGAVWALGALALVDSLVVMAYTALLLRAFAGVEFWDSLLLVALFVASGVSTGIAVVVATMVATLAAMRYEGLVGRLLKADVLVIAAEAIVLAAYMATSWFVAPVQVEALLVGDLAGVFWVGFVVCGMVAPLALNVGSRVVSGLVVHPAALCALVLVGGFCLRWCVAMVPR